MLAPFCGLAVASGVAEELLVPVLPFRLLNRPGCVVLEIKVVAVEVAFRLEVMVSVSVLMCEAAASAPDGSAEMGASEVFASEVFSAEDDGVGVLDGVGVSDGVGMLDEVEMLDAVGMLD